MIFLRSDTLITARESAKFIRGQKRSIFLRIADQLYSKSQKLYRRINDEKQKVII